MIGLIDGDILVFRAGFAAEKNYWYLTIGEETREFQYKKDAMEALDEALPGKYSREEGTDYQLWSERKVEPVENALHLVNKQMHAIMDACDLTEFDVVVYLSGGYNFRYDVAKTRPYKGNRDASHRPTHEEAIKNYMRSKWNTVVTDGIEADDAIGIGMNEDAICITIDKDLDMIPGLHYNFKDEVHYEISPEQAWQKFCLQLLTGDTTDNIPGLPNVGAKKAEKLLDGIDPEDYLDVIAGAYASKSKQRDWFGYMLEQAALLWIQQEPDQKIGDIIPQSLAELGGPEDGSDTPCLLY
jgi:hypothetical protein